jgi:cold shock CspA family protein
MATTEVSSLTGCVKWFDNGLNYGFITVLSEGAHNNTDVFVHQSNIQTKRDCFRTLYTGECVQFTLAKSDNEKHPYHAVNVVGYNGTMLHCENPNYHPRGGRGGRGGARGGGFGGARGGGRGGFGGSSSYRPQGTAGQEVQTQCTTAEFAAATPVDAPAPAPTPTPVADTSAAESPARRGRGRGRGKVATE